MMELEGLDFDSVRIALFGCCCESGDDWTLLFGLGMGPGSGISKGVPRPLAINH